MNYLYVLFGITIWVFIVSFSSNLLISNENTKLMGDIRKKVDSFSQSIGVTTSEATETYKNYNNSKSIETPKVQSKTIESLIKNPVIKSNPVKSNLKREEEYDDD